MANKTLLTGNWDLAIKSNNSMTFHCVWNPMDSIELHNAHPDCVILPYDIFIPNVTASKSINRPE